jgi:dephospho-CoA kinase
VRSAGEGQRPYVLGITGTIGSGKSLVGEILQEENIPVLDSDKVVHLLLDGDQEVRQAIEKRFGQSVVGIRPGFAPAVNRAALGELVFNDELARKDLERIVHPATISYCENWTITQQSPLVTLLVPLLFEADQKPRYNEIWTVICEEALLRSRLKSRNRFSDADIDKRLAAQLSQKVKAERADRIIDNSGTIENTRQQVLQFLAACRTKLNSE